MKFVLLVEGHTEHDSLKCFLKKWLDPRLTRPVGIDVARFNGWAELVEKTPRQARRRLNGPQSDQIIAVIGLMDLYGPVSYPPRAQSADERYEWAKQDMEARVNHPRFRQFFAVHEIEAWFLSDPSILPGPVRAALPKKAGKPETVNFKEPPAQLLDRLYLKTIRRSYSHRANGSLLLRDLDPAKARDKCPRLRQMLDEMVRLAKAAGL